MSDIIAMHRADLVDAVTVAVQPLKARITELETSLETWKNDATTYHQRAWNAEGQVSLLERQLADAQAKLTASNPEGGK